MSREHASHWLEREDFGEVTVVRLWPPNRSMDDDTTRTIFDIVYGLLDVARHKLVLDLEAVDFLPSLALGKLVMLNRKALAANGGLALCRLSPRVDEVLETTRLKPLLLRCFATEAEAVAALG
jgi:anti-anti-sigma factor